MLRAANNESSEVIDNLLPVTFILTLRPGLIMSKTSDDLLLACGGRVLSLPVEVIIFNIGPRGLSLKLPVGI